MIRISKKENLAKEIYKEILKSHQDKINIDDYCFNKIKKEYSNMSDLQITDELDEIVNRVKLHLKKRIEYCKTKGISPEYELNDYPPNVLLRYSFKHKESELTSFLRKRRKEVFEAIDSLSWKSFEYLSVYLLHIDGVNPIKLTKSNQEGIDFCGLYDISKGNYSIIIPNKFKTRIVGQVKHYSKKIQPKLIRAFNTYCRDVKNEEEKVIKNLPNWFTNNKAPILGIFITTSDYTGSAITYATKEWIILKNGEQVVDSLIRSPMSNNWVKKEGNKFTFDKTLFLNSFKNS